MLSNNQTSNPNMFQNAVVIVYMFLASFPYIGQEECVAVQLVLEHILTYNIELGRISLTHQAYVQTLNVLPQLMVLASRYGLVYPTSRVPSFMNVAVILQTIIEPLMNDLSAAARMEVYATEEEGRQLFKLKLSQLQATVDAWVCEHPDLASKPTSSPPPCDKHLHRLCARDQGDAWWISPCLAKSQSSGPYPPAPLSESTAVEIPVEDEERPADLSARQHGDVWWTIPLSTEARLAAAKLKPILSQCGSPTSKEQTYIRTARGHGDVWWNPMQQTRARSSAARPKLPLLTKENLRQMDQFHQACLPSRAPTNCASISGHFYLFEDNVIDVPISDYSPHQAKSGPPFHSEFTPATQAIIAQRSPNSQLSPPWTTQDFSNSTPSFGSPTSNNHWNQGSFYSDSNASFGPTTPMDFTYPSCRYQSSFDGSQQALSWDEISISDDIHERPHIEVRKAKKATMARKIMRKLKAALDAVRK